MRLIKIVRKLIIPSLIVTTLIAVTGACGYKIVKVNESESREQSVSNEIAYSDDQNKGEDESYQIEKSYNYIAENELVIDEYLKEVISIQDRRNYIRSSRGVAIDSSTEEGYSLMASDSRELLYHAQSIEVPEDFLPIHDICLRSLELQAISTEAVVEALPALDYERIQIATETLRESDELWKEFGLRINNKVME
jgi:hypothetical protein